ncbi:MAG: phytanoyl-CoA dioxygenase family protein [Planctomycetes bacterium]|nr:phytanoyl-CoA dioxygenase family protein [Planctomycetota bacterium]
MSCPLRDDFLRDGFILLRGGIPLPLLEELRSGLAPILAHRGLGRIGTLRHQTILEPSSYHPSFKEFLDLPRLNRAAAAVIDSTDIAFAGLGVLIGSADHRVCRWHRDFKDGYPELPALLKRHHADFIQFNCALYDDLSLWVVPGSHRRASTPGESAFSARFDVVGFNGTYEQARAIDPDPLSGMPGAINVVLAAGDCVLYNPLLWHAAEYRPEWIRTTLHGGWRKTEMMYAFEAMRWGLEHNPWLLEPSYLGDAGTFLGPQLARYAEAVRHFHPELTAPAHATG